MTNKMFDNSDLLCIFIAQNCKMNKLDSNIDNIAGNGSTPGQSSCSDPTSGGFCLFPAQNIHRYMKEIKLTQGFFTQVDDEDYEFLNKLKWRVKKDGGTYYAISTNIKSDNSYKTIKMHRLIMNAPKGTQLDHKDRNGLNNQKSNLRFCTHSQNMANRKSLGKSKYLGVSIYKGKYMATITTNNKKKYLGIYDSEIDAAIAYDKAAKEYHGEFANLNL